MKKGIDLSAWNTGIDYTTLSKDIDFVILREGYRQTEDAMFRTHLSAFRALRVPVPAVYHFIYATDVTAAKEEAKACIAHVEAAGLGKDVMIFADFEQDTIDKAAAKGVYLGANECNTFTRAFVETIEASGYRAGIYTNPDYIQRMYDASLINAYPLWLACYGVDAPPYKCLFWQRSDKGRLSGSDDDLDLDVWYDMADTDVIETATAWMEALAADPSHGYDQTYRWGEKGDYDCSSAVITAWETAGVLVRTKGGATYTGNMRPAFLKHGFLDVTGAVNLATGAGLQRGDVLLNTAHHTAMYIGGGQEVEASINEKGTATGGAPGDQTGREILVRPYHNYPWTCVLRYGFGPCSGEACAVTLPESYGFLVYEVQEGSKGASVRLLQRLLGGLDVDGDFGPRTAAAVRRYQAASGLAVDGIVGPKTWGSLLGV